MTFPRLRFLYVFALVGGILTADLTMQAQTISPSDGGNARRAQLRRRGARIGAGARRTTVARREATSPTTQPTAPVTVAPPPARPEYLYGQAQVTVRGNEDPVIRLGLAQHGPTIIEFPAADNFFAVHPGGSQIVTYDESPTLATDHYLVFRAGSNFLNGVSEDGRSEARASISVQMQSGMFVTFLFYPVRDVARMAHRCVVMYSRDEVVAARRAAGLAVNLDGRSPQATQTPSVSSRRVGDTGGASTEAGSADANDQLSAGVASVTLESGELVGNAVRSNRRRRANELPREAQRALREALAAPARFNRWSAPTHGLSISALAPIDVDDQRRLTVIAVKNTTQNGLRIVAGGPDLDLLTLNEAGQPVQVRAVNRLHLEASTVGGAIPAGAIIYYAIIYETPVLDAAQRVRLSIAQNTAADQPASIDLSSANRTNQ